MTGQRTPIKATKLTRAFWDATKQGRFLLQYDPCADRYQFYLRTVSLFSTAELEWREAKGEGSLVAVSACHVPSPGLAPEAPYLLAIVELAEGPHVFGRVAEVKSGADLKVGQRMKIVWGDEFGDGREFLFSPVS